MGHAAYHSIFLAEMDITVLHSMLYLVYIRSYVAKNGRQNTVLAVSTEKNVARFCSVDGWNLNASAGAAPAYL